jgi:hypothetical protein
MSFPSPYFAVAEAGLWIVSGTHYRLQTERKDKQNTSPWLIPDSMLHVRHLGACFLSEASLPRMMTLFSVA